MAAKSIEAELLAGTVTVETLARRMVRNPARLPEVLTGLDHDRAAVRYGCEKILRRLSESHPALLYPHRKALFDLLNHEKTFLRWGAMQLVANLAPVDEENFIDRRLKRYLAPIEGSVMVAAANAIGGGAKIGVAKPHLADRIAKAVLRVESASYQTAECRHVALGQAIVALGDLFPFLKKKGRESALALARRARKNPRPATRKKAEAFLKKHGDGKA